VTRGIEGPSAEVWIPRVLVRCQANSTAGPAFCSTFVALVEPYEKRSSIAQIRRLPLQTDRGDACDGTHVAVQVQLVDGRRDLLVALDPERLSGSVTQPDWNLRLDGEMCMVRRGANGRIDRLVLCKGRSLVANGVALRLKRSAELIEVSFEGGRPAVVAGYLDDVHEIFAS